MLFRIRKPFRLCAIGSMLLPFVAFAEPTPATMPGAADVTWPDVVAAVAGGNPELAALGVQPEIEAGNLRQAAAIPNPELEGEVSEFGGSGERRGFDVAETTVTLNQTLELGGKRAARTTVAQRALEEAKAIVAARRQELLGEARQRFVDLLQKQELVALECEAVALAAQALAAEESRLEMKAVTAVDVNRAKAAVATTRASLARAEMEMGAARIRLAALWGDADARFARAEGTLEQREALPALEAILARIPNTPGRVRARLAVDRAGAERAPEHTKRHPDVNVYGGITRYSETRDHAFVAGVSIPLPLFDRNQGAIAAAAARQRQAESEARASELAARSTLARQRQLRASPRMRCPPPRPPTKPCAKVMKRASTAGWRSSGLGKRGSTRAVSTSNIWLSRTRRWPRSKASWGPSCPLRCPES